MNEHIKKRNWILIGFLTGLLPWQLIFLSFPYQVYSYNGLFKIWGFIYVPLSLFFSLIGILVGWMLYRLYTNKSRYYKFFLVLFIIGYLIIVYYFYGFQSLVWGIKDV